MKRPRATLSRRALLAHLGLSPVWSPASLVSSATAQARDAEIRETPLSSFQTLLTPTGEFFVRNHFTAPNLTEGGRLRVVGRVRLPFEASYAEIAHLRSRTITVTLECAGSGLGGVSTTTWEGVPLATLLKRAGLGPSTKYVRLVGADRGVKESEEAIPFARSIPIEKAMHPDTIVAFRMNGGPLPVEHGYPCRAIVPGWYGMDSVKWLARIEALDHADTSYFMTQHYVAVRLATVGSDQHPVTAMRVKSLIVEPRSIDAVAPGPVTVRGVAWAGENQIAQVEVSTDAGKSWSLASLDRDIRPYTWVLWTYAWEPRTPGSYIIVARATDDRGNTQPPARDHLRIDTYELNWYHSVRCEVR
jgi:DMSO/TMAO reductase YedYZ molybdopterin-dependent catalytic subunit